MKRIVLLAEGATMAHFVRLAALAEELRKSEHTVHLYAPSQYWRYLDVTRFRVAELPTMPSELFLANLAKGTPAFPADVIRRYVESDRRIFQEILPDLVIGDMRVSLPISARLEKIPCAVMMNAYWSPYAKRRSILPELPITRVIPPKLLGPLYRLTEPLAYRHHVKPLNTVRREFGLPEIPPDLRAAYTDGDYCLYPDIPEFVPVSNAPPSHFYVGICDWNPPMEKPEWWERMGGDARRKVFVSLGSSGPLRALPVLLRALSSLGVAVILSTSGRARAAQGSVAYQASLLPFRETASHADVVVSHGGSGGLYPAMAAGTPVLGIPSNADMQLSTACLVESGAGLGVRVEEATERSLRTALERLLNEPSFKQRAAQWADIYSRYDSGEMFRAFLRRVL